MILWGDTSKFYEKLHDPYTRYAGMNVRRDCLSIECAEPPMVHVWKCTKNKTP